jgi:cation transport ATPase
VYQKPVGVATPAALKSKARNLHYPSYQIRVFLLPLSMTIAIAAAAAIGQFFTAMIITLFVLVAEVLEGLTVGRGRKAIRDLLEFLPREVSVRRSGAIHAVSAEELRIGDAILVAPGGRIPVDGTVLSGHSFVDESRITGESMPAEKTAEADVFAGSINQSGALEIRAERIGRDTSYGKIIEAVERAERSRAPVQTLADRLAGHLWVSRWAPRRMWRGKARTSCYSATISSVSLKHCGWPDGCGGQSGRTLPAR